MLPRTYLGHQLELRGNYQNIGSDAFGEHHLLVLLPLDWCGWISRVEWIVSALLQDCLQTHVNLGLVALLGKWDTTDVLDDVRVNDSHIDVVYLESLRVSEENRFRNASFCQRETHAIESRLWKWMEMLNLSGWWYDHKLGLYLVLSNFAHHILLNLHKELVVFHELQLIICTSEADDAFLYVLVHGVDEGSKQDQNLWLVSFYQCNEVL